MSDFTETQTATVLWNDARVLIVKAMRMLNAVGPQNGVSAEDISKRSKIDIPAIKRYCSKDEQLVQSQVVTQETHEGEGQKLFYALTKFGTYCSVKNPPVAPGVDLSSEEWTELLCDEFNAYFRDISLDEVVLRPRMALAFCDHIKLKHGWTDCPEDLILRALMKRRKNPNK